MLMNSSYHHRFKNKHYMTKRTEIIQNLFHIYLKLRLNKQSLYLAICYMDYILFSMTIDIKYELLGVCCLLIAGSKFIYIS